MLGVLEQNPSKQGLKPEEVMKAKIRPYRGFRAKSIKTRIETIRRSYGQISSCKVLEQNPSKQGLKRDSKMLSFIGTSQVLEQNPSKQGLKHFRFFTTIIASLRF